MSNPTVDEFIGAAVAKLRAARGHSQRTFSPLIGLTQGQLSRLEKGQAQWTAEKMQAAADALKVPMRMLLPDEPQVELGVTLSPDEHTLIQAIRRSDDVSAVRIVMGILHPR